MLVFTHSLAFSFYSRFLLPALFGSFLFFTTFRRIRVQFRNTPGHFSAISFGWRYTIFWNLFRICRLRRWSLNYWRFRGFVLISPLHKKSLITKHCAAKSCMWRVPKVWIQIRELGSRRQQAHRRATRGSAGAKYRKMPKIRDRPTAATGAGAVPVPS